MISKLDMSSRNRKPVFMDKCLLCHGTDIHGSASMENTQVVSFHCQDERCDMKDAYQVMHACCLNKNLKDQGCISTSVFRSRKKNGLEGKMMMSRESYVRCISCFVCNKKEVTKLYFCDINEYVKKFAVQDACLQIRDEQDDEPSFADLLKMLMPDATPEYITEHSTPWTLPSIFGVAA